MMRLESIGAQRAIDTELAREHREKTATETQRHRGHVPVRRRREAARATGVGRIHEPFVDPVGSWIRPIRSRMPARSAGRPPNGLAFSLCAHRALASLRLCVSVSLWFIRLCVL